MSVIHSDFETLLERSRQLYQLNIIACCVQLLLFCLAAWYGSDSMGLNVIQSIAIGVFILIVIVRPCVLAKKKQTHIFWLALLICAVLAFITIVIQAATSNRENILPIALSTSHSGASLIGDFTTPTCTAGDVTTTYTNFRKWMDCLQTKYSCDTDACVALKIDPSAYIAIGGDDKFVLRKGVPTVFSDGLYVWWGVALFTIVTASFHYVLAYSADTYSWVLGALGKEDFGKGLTPLPNNNWQFSVPYIQWINSGIQPMRWAEYSITASVMIVLVFIINGVTDIYLLAFAYIIMNLVNSFGAAIDYTNSGAIVAWFWVCAVGALTWQFSLLWSAYLENISPYIEQEATKELWGQYFGFITALNIIVTLTYSGFGITNLYHQLKRFNCCWRRKKRKGDYVDWDKECCGMIMEDIIPPEEQATIMFDVERAYLVQSFLSKTLLCICVLVGAQQRI